MSEIESVGIGNPGDKVLHVKIWYAERGRDLLHVCDIILSWTSSSRIVYGTLHLSNLRSQFRTLPIMPMKKPNNAGAAQITNVWYFARRASGGLFAFMDQGVVLKPVATWRVNQSSEHVGRFSSTECLSTSWLPLLEKDQSSRLLAPVKTQNKPACWLTILQVIPPVRTLLINPKRSLGSTGKIRQLTINKTPTVGRETLILIIIKLYLS